MSMSGEVREVNVVHSFAERQQIGSQNLFYNSSAKQMVSFGVDCNFIAGYSRTMFSTFHGASIEFENSCTAESRMAAYVVDSYKIMLGSYIVEPDECDFDEYRVSIRICTFELTSDVGYRVLKTHAMVKLNTLPNQVVSYKGKCPIAVRVEPGQFFGVEVVFERTLGLGVNICVLNMVSEVTRVDDGSYIYPRPYQ